MDLSFIFNGSVQLSQFYQKHFNQNKISKMAVSWSIFSNALTNIKHGFAVLDCAEGCIRTYPSVNME